MSKTLKMAEFNLLFSVASDKHSEFGWLRHCRRNGTVKRLHNPRKTEWRRSKDKRIQRQIGKHNGESI